MSQNLALGSKNDGGESVKKSEIEWIVDEDKFSNTNSKAANAN